MSNYKIVHDYHKVTVRKKSKVTDHLKVAYHNSESENPEIENPEIEKGKFRNQNVTFLKDFHRGDNENPEIKSQYYQSIRNEMVKSYMKLINN